MTRNGEPGGAVARPADIGHVHFEGGFWAGKQEINRQRTLPSQYEQLEKTNRLAALDPDFRPGDRTSRHIFWDSDTAKWLEAAAYSLTTHPDPKLAGQVEGVIAALARLQGGDGYLNSWYQTVEPDKRWTNLRDCHELYCAGHLMEAAVAHNRATGKAHFLEIMCRYADYIGTVFGTGEGQKRGYPGHEEIELALVKLYRATGESRYLDMSRYFVDERGAQPHYFDVEAAARGEERQSYAFGAAFDYNQAHIPVRDQDRAVGHSVRAMYIYCGMADLVAETGDAELAAALDKLWANVTGRQMYVTGSVGSSHQGERFTDDYDLPEETSYCETCAAIGLVFWAQRMANVHGDSRYGDVAELALYNGVLSGLALDGEHYFYVNPLASAGNHHRQEWFGCACCPPNIARLIASLGSYAYSEGDEGWVHLYEPGVAHLEIGGQAVRVEQRTQYPWEGRVEIEVAPGGAGSFALNLRLPGWCRGAKASVNGEVLDVAAATGRGYLRLDRQWGDGDTVALDLPMPVERVRAHPAVRMANGKVALQRGPVVYCLEEADNAVTPLSRLVLPRDTVLEARLEPDLLGGIALVEGQAQVRAEGEWGDELYRAGAESATEGCSVRAVPYCVWNNREAGQMLVWLREC